LFFNNRFGLKSKAQSSIETLIILATGLFILSALTVIVYDQLNSNYYQQQQQIGSNAINTLAKEINDAYFLGPGTVKNVIITMPSMVDYNKSYILGKYLVLNVAGSDLFASTKVNARGIWPNTSGSFVFVITSFDDFVSVSAQPISFSPSQISEALQQDSSMDVNVVVANSSSLNKDYNLVINFAVNDLGEQMVSSSVSQVTFVAGAETVVPFSFACSRNSFGPYSGTVVFIPLDSSDSNISFPVNLVCSSSQTKLSIYPASKLINAFSSDFFTENFLVCNNSTTLFSGSSASVSGQVFSYAFTSFSGDINANSCRTLYLGIIAPLIEGAYSGLLRVDSSGYTAYADLNLVVSLGVSSIILNVKDSFDDANLSGFDIDCSGEGYDFVNQSSPVSIDFNAGSYSCVFSKSGYYSNTSIVVADVNKSVDVYLARLPVGVVLNVRDSFDDANLSGFGIDCNVNAYDRNSQSSPVSIDFNVGSYSCVFLKTGYDSNVSVLVADVNKSMTLYLSRLPLLGFVAPTLDSNVSVTNSFVDVNVSITKAVDLNEFKFNWADTNYSLYDTNLALMMNFDNVSTLDENANFVRDLSKYGNNGTVNGATWSSSGKYGGAYTFDGSDYINIPTNMGLGIGNVTLIAWVFLSDTSKKGCFVHIGGSTSNGYCIGVGSGNVGFNGNTLIGEFYGVRDIPTSTSLGTGWHQVAFILNSSGSPTFYKDGVNVGSYAGANALSPNNNAKMGTDSSNWFIGTIDEVRIYSRALDANEITQLYYSNLKKYDVNKWNFYSTESDLIPGDYNYQAFAKDANGNSNNTEKRKVTVIPVSVVLNVKDLVSGVHLSGVGIDCNVNAYDRSNQSSPVSIDFTTGSYSCVFSKSGYYSSTGLIVADVNKSVDVYLARLPFGVVLNVKDSVSGVHLSGVGIDCNVDAYDRSNQSSPVSVDFNLGSYSCVFLKTGYDSNTGVIVADVNKSIDVYLAHLPLLNFVAPTLDSNVSVTNSFVDVNVSITKAVDLNEFKWGWNDVNYSFYDSNLVLMMNFDKVSALGENSTLVKDLSKYGNDGTVNGSAVWSSSGRYGGAYIFDGSNDYIDISHSASLNISQYITISAWIYPTASMTNCNGIVSKGAAGNYGYMLYGGGGCGNATNTIRCLIGGVACDTTLTVNLNAWNYVACTQDGTNITIYLNGSREIVCSNPGGITTNSNKVKIGKLYDGVNDHYFTGTIDEVRIYNRALSANEVKQHYYSNLSKYDTNKWAFYASDSNLSAGNYSYRAFAKNADNNASQTERRGVTILEECPATGGTKTIVGNYCVNTFTGNGTFIVPSGSLTCDVLAVGGGGGGGGGESNPAGDAAGGGGGGGYREISNFAVAAQSYGVTVGTGGPGAASSSTNGTKGGDTIFSTITATGGGYGAREEGPGGAGGSGGGGGGPCTSGDKAGGAGNTPATTPSQGNTGGTATDAACAYRGGAGGGGASSVGSNNLSTGAGGDGGNGTTSYLFGSAVLYAGGGGGGTGRNAGTLGGTGKGGGGRGGNSPNGAGRNGAINSGGGGGAAGSGTSVGGNGGSGIAIVRYLKRDFNYPFINFVSPTPATGTSTTNKYVQIKVNTTEANLSEFKWNWADTNYSLYDVNLVLMMNFDNISNLGETPISVVDSSKYLNNGFVVGGSSLSVSYNMTANANSYVYEDLTSVTDYTIVAGSCVEYDIFWTSALDRIAFDFSTTVGGYELRSVGALDQRGLLAHPDIDLSTYALNKWYHRKITLPSSVTGQTIVNYDIACESDETATKTAYLRNIVITDCAGTVRKTIYTGGTYTHANHLVNSGVVNAFGTDYGTSLVGASGKYGAALNFDGTDDYIDLGNPPSLQITKNQTISMWIYPTDVSARRNPYAKAYGGEGTITQEIGADGTNCNLSYYYGTNGGNSTPYQGFSTVGNPIAKNTWTYISFVRDLTAMKLRWYINGSLSGETDANYSSATAGSLTAYIGNGYVSKYAGKIDEVRIYDRALSTNEIKQLYYSNLNKYDTYKWNFDVNEQTLSVGSYNYRAFAKDTNNNASQTEQRSITILN